MKRWHLGAILAMGMATYLVTEIGAQGIPQDRAMIYTGFLEDGGIPVDGMRNIALSIWKDPTSQETEDQLCVTLADNHPITDGHFRVELGNACTSSIRTHTNTWLEIRVDGASLGRSRLGAVPYAVSTSVTPGNVPIGTVIDWWRPSAAFPIPEGYAIADGSKVLDTRSPLFDIDLPNLNNAFVRGVTEPSDIGTIGGQDFAVVNTGSAGAHTATTSSSGGHSHVWSSFEFSTKIWRAGNNAMMVDWGTGMDSAGTGYYPIISDFSTNANYHTSSDGAHTHTVAVSAHTHSVTVSTVPRYVGMLKLVRIF